MPADTLLQVQLFDFKDYINTSAPSSLLIRGNGGNYLDISEYEGMLKFTFVGSSTDVTCPIELRIWQSQDGIDAFGDPIWSTDADLEATTTFQEKLIDSNLLEKYIVAEITHYGNADEKASLGVFMVGKKKYG